MKFFQSNVEKDFEFFVKSLPILQPVEFCGLAKILCVPMVYEDRMLEFDKEKYNQLEKDEKIEYVSHFNRPMDEVLNDVMDKFLTLPKRKRREINQMLKDIKRGK